MEIEKEVGKTIEGYPDYYVSNLGRVKSFKKGIEHILKPGINNKLGYMYVQLCYNGKAKSCSVHRLVAIAFIANPSGLPQVNHRNEIKTDNRVKNLEGCSAKYNNNFGTIKNRRSDALLNNRYKSKPIRQLTLDGKPIASYPSIQEAVRISGMSFGRIMGYLRGTIKNPRKYKGEYIL